MEWFKPTAVWILALFSLAHPAWSQVSNYHIAYHFHTEGSTDSAIFYYQKALQDYQPSETEYVGILTNLSILYKNKGQYDRALEYAFESLQSLDSASRVKASSLNNIAVIYYLTGDYQRSLEYQYETLEMRRLIGYNKGIAMSYNNLGNLFNELQLYDSAVIHFEQSLHIKRELEDSVGMAVVHNNLGWTYLELDILDSASHHLQIALHLKKQLGQLSANAYTYSLLGQLYLKLEEWSLAKLNLDSALLISESFELPDISKQVLYDLSEYYKLIGNYRLQSEMLHRYIEINEQLLNEEKANALSELQVKYDVENKENEIVYLEQLEETNQSKIHYQQQLVLVFFTVSLVLAGLVVLIAILLKRNNRKRNVIEHLHQEMQHRIKNNLQLLSGLLNLQSNAITDSEAVSALKIGQTRVNAMALIHQLLYASTEQSAIDAQTYISELCDYLERTFAVDKQELSVEVIMDQLKVDVDKMISIGLIINELVTNAFKHAFHNTNKPVISIKLRKGLDTQLFLEIKDNGSGIPTDILNKSTSSFGMRLIKMLTKQLDAEVKVFNEQGAIFQFSFNSV